MRLNNVQQLVTVRALREPRRPCVAAAPRGRTSVHLLLCGCIVSRMLCAVESPET